MQPRLGRDISAVIRFPAGSHQVRCTRSPGAAAKAHWGLPDPSRLGRTEQEIEDSFNRVMRTIESRINLLLQEPFKGTQKMELTEILERIGEHR